jgi:sortase A
LNRKLALSLGSALMLAGAALLGVYWWNLRDAAQAQQRAKEWLNGASLRPAPQIWSPAPTPGHSVRRGDPVGELDIPRLHLSIMIFEGDNARILKLGGGHIPGMALPPGKGNVGIAAHRDTFFRPLRGIHQSDEITLRTPAGTFRYRVTQTEVVPPSNIHVLALAPGRDLTLVTCYPFNYVGNAPQRFIVHAKRTG